MSIEEIVRQIKADIAAKEENIAKLISSGYTVTIRPVKDGIKVTSHKEKVV